MTYIIIYYQVHNRVVTLVANVHMRTKQLLIRRGLRTTCVNRTYICVSVCACVFRYIITNSARLYWALCL